MRRSVALPKSPVSRWLHVRSVRAAAGFEAVFALLGALVFGAILWAAVVGFTHAWQTGDRFGAAQVFTFPKWPIWLIVLVGSACVLAAFLAQAKSEAWISKSGSR
jgi:hypothetical protein